MLRHLFRHFIQQRSNRGSAKPSQKQALATHSPDADRAILVKIPSELSESEPISNINKLVPQLDSNNSKSLLSHARALYCSNSKEDALYYYKLLELQNPDDPVVYIEQIATLRDLSRHKESIAVYDRAHARGMDSAELRHIHATTLYFFGMLDQAREKYVAALELAPNSPVILSDYGRILCELGHLTEAEQNLSLSMSLDPGNQVTFLNLGLLYTNLQRYSDASFYYDKAIEIDPSSNQTRFCRSLYQLLNADFENGWRGYSLRDHPRHFRRCALDFSLWNGEETRDQTLLIHGEQGLGDEIMFASCIPDVLQHVSYVVLECNGKLAPIFERSFPTIKVFPRTELDADRWKDTVRRINIKIPIGDLPNFYRTSINKFPQHRGYLKANALRIRHWRNEVERLGRGFRVGISWRGGTKATRRSTRSTQLLDWLPILRTPNCIFLSLQYDSSESEVSEFAQAHSVPLYGISASLADYDETAALVAGLDMVISVQTAIVHLAGALGKDTWVMLPPTPEWRYGLRNNNMIWYPSVELIRAEETGVWSKVIQEIARRLVTRATHQG